jgi:ATP-binding cassette, subfamily C (CFTR/MRP), member 1
VPQARHAFLFAVLKTFRWQILAGVFPRLCMTAFNFTQPFLMNTLLNWLGQENTGVKRNDGYGLIGAYALVFLGIAVSQPIIPQRMIGINKWFPDLHW